jgi:glutaredoxin 3
MPPLKVNGYVEDLINSNKIVIFSKTTCPYCERVKGLFKTLNQTYTAVELDRTGNFFCVNIA